MNKVLKMDYKGQTTVLSVILVLVGMVLVPVITEKAEADTTDATASTLQAGKLQLTLLEKYIDKSKADAYFRTQPTQKGDMVKWSTVGYGGGSASGDVTFFLKIPATATLLILAV